MPTDPETAAQAEAAALLAAQQAEADAIAAVQAATN